MATPCKQLLAPEGCRVHCKICGSDICYGDRYTQVDTGVPSGIPGHNIVNNICGNCPAPCDRTSTPWCSESAGTADGPPWNCDKCHRRIKPYTRYIIWHPSTAVMADQPHPAFAYRHVQCGSPCFGEA